MFRPELTGESSRSPPGCAKEIHQLYFKIYHLLNTQLVSYTEFYTELVN